MGVSKKLAQVGAQCVACGCCVTVCPRGAMAIRGGVTAQVDGARCVGCGKCGAVCPAAVITMVQREVVA